MQFRIADTFTDSLARLTGEEQKAVKTTAFDLQLNPAAPGLSFHKLDRARDRNFWSVRVSGDIRLIVHRTDSSLMLCYVDHHDRAYQWAERRRLETHPTTGAAQWVEVRERVEEIIVRRQAETGAPALHGSSKPLLFSQHDAAELMRYGVPQDLVPTVLQANEDTLLSLADHLPAEAAEALLELATGGSPKPAPPPAPHADPFSHPDAQRRFRVMRDVEELARALDFPWDKWTTFLHPAQRQWVERDYNGPARVSGSAGTGKTIVALHRAVHLARSRPESRVLLTTFSDALASALQGKLRRLISHEPRLAERLEVQALDATASRLYSLHVGRFRLASVEDEAAAVERAAAAVTGHRFTTAFIRNEWLDVVDAWQLDTWEGYRDFRRLGRKTRLSASQRELLWTIFSRIGAELAGAGLLTRAAVCTRLAQRIAQMKHPPYDFVVVDEAQDVSPSQLRLLAAIGSTRPDGLFFAGDVGQRIFQTPFSWKALGIDVRGRSRTLHINYRTSHQIRAQADRLLGPEVSDADGNIEDRRGTVSVFNGPEPDVRTFGDEAAECTAVAAWLQAQRAAKVAPEEIGVIVRSEAQLVRAEAALRAAGLPCKVLGGQIDTTHGHAAVCTMHQAKGLEFRVVVVMACDDEIMPLQERIEAVTDEGDLDEVYHTERHLLYVACTRARDRLLVTGVKPGSEFLEDLGGRSGT